MLTFVVAVKNDENQNHLYLQWLEEALSKGIHVVLVFDGLGEIGFLDELETLRRTHLGILNIEKVDYGNPGETRNRGFQSVNTDWVAFVDSDDFVHVDAFLDLVEQTSRVNKSIGVGNYISNMGGSKRVICGHRNNTLVRRVRYPGLWRYVFLKKRIGNVRFHSGRGGEDIAYLYELAIDLRELHVSDRVVYEYNMRIPGQLTQVVDMRQELQDIRSKINRRGFRISPRASFSQLLRIQLFLQYSMSCLKGILRK